MFFFIRSIASNNCIQQTNEDKDTITLPQPIAQTSKEPMSAPKTSHSQKPMTQMDMEVIKDYYGSKYNMGTPKARLLCVSYV